MNLGAIMDCCNGECGWSGPLRECCHFKHDTKPLCPQCREVVEPRDVNAEGDAPK